VAREETPSPLSIEIRNGLKQKTLRDLIRFESKPYLQAHQRDADSSDFAESAKGDANRCSTIFVPSA
jgi:hypothetical protein